MFDFGTKNSIINIWTNTKTIEDTLIIQVVIILRILSQVITTNHGTVKNISYNRNNVVIVTVMVVK